MDKVVVDWQICRDVDIPEKQRKCILLGEFGQKKTAETAVLDEIFLFQDDKKI